MSYEEKVCKLINLGWSDADAREIVDLEEEDKEEE